MLGDPGLSQRFDLANKICRARRGCRPSRYMHNTMCESIWSAGSEVKSWVDLYGQVADLLFKVGFLGYAKSANGKAVYSYEEARKLNVVGTLSDIQVFEIHPAFRPALSIYDRSTN
jgi:hypothetical protein